LFQKFGFTLIISQAKCSLKLRTVRNLFSQIISSPYQSFTKNTPKFELSHDKLFSVLSFFASPGDCPLGNRWHWAILGSLIREVIEISQTIDASKMRINIEQNNHDSDMACYAVFERKLEIKLPTNLLYYCLNKLRNLTTCRRWNKNVDNCGRSCHIHMRWKTGDQLKDKITISLRYER